MDTLLYITFMSVCVLVAWVYHQFKQHRNRLLKLSKLIEHPVIIKNIDDMETVENIQRITNIEHMKMTLLWVPLAYVVVILLGCGMTMIEQMPNYPSLYMTIVSFITAGYITAGMRFDFYPGWLLAAATIVNHASAPRPQSAIDAIEYSLDHIDDIDFQKQVEELLEDDSEVDKRLSANDKKDINKQ
jgi:hypothetical protein